MELPSEVLIHNAQLGLQGSVGTLLQIQALGYYEVNVSFGERTHRVLLPVSDTVIIAKEPEQDPGTPAEDLEIER
ncbi:MAG: hypothetical protein AAF481_02000 [Acidobacteriota bacterium]